MQLAVRKIPPTAITNQTNEFTTVGASQGAILPSPEQGLIYLCSECSQRLSGRRFTIKRCHIGDFLELRHDFRMVLRQVAHDAGIPQQVRQICCIARRTAAVVRALPCNTCPITPPLLAAQNTLRHHKVGLNIIAFADLCGQIDWTKGAVDGSFSPGKRRR